MTSEGRARTEHIDSGLTVPWGSGRENPPRLRAAGAGEVKITRVHGGCPGTGADEGRDYLRKAPTSWRYALTRGCPNGKPTRTAGTTQGEGTQGTETSQYLKEKKETSIPSVAASEPGSAQTAELALRGCRTKHPRSDPPTRTCWNGRTTEGERPVGQRAVGWLGT